MVQVECRTKDRQRGLLIARLSKKRHFRGLEGAEPLLWCRWREGPGQPFLKEVPEGFRHLLPLN